jgi:putative heme transporter
MPELPDTEEISAEGINALKVPAELVEHELAAKSLTRRVTEILGSLAIVVALFVFAIPAITNVHYSEIWDQFWKLDLRTFTGLVVVWIAVMLIYTGVLTTALPGLKHSQALVINFAGSAVSNVVPFGGAVGVAATYAMGLSWGFAPPPITLSILVTGIWNVFTKLGLPVVALFVLMAAGHTTAGLIAPAVVGLVILGAGLALLSMVLRSEQLARRVARLADHASAGLGRFTRRAWATRWGARVMDFRHDSLGLLRERWRALTIWMLAYTAGQYVLLLLCVRALGANTADLGWVQVLAAFAFANALTTIAITPSGVGFVEAGTVAALIAFGGQEAGSAAAVFLFRAFTYALEIPLGALAWGVWAGRRSWRRPVVGIGAVGASSGQRAMVNRSSRSGDPK